MRSSPSIPCEPALDASGLGPVWTAAEPEALSPDERDAVIRDGFVTDPVQVPIELIERARRRTDARVAATGSRTLPS